eukprot:CCRYP_009319-RH/>CCRYP_009319-RH protein AED:0.47 eAED:0.57 QI:0/-1/0/1/-1/0/1/0/49
MNYQRVLLCMSRRTKRTSLSSNHSNRSMMLYSWMTLCMLFRIKTQITTV